MSHSVTGVASGGQTQRSGRSTGGGFGCSTLKPVCPQLRVRDSPPYSGDCTARVNVKGDTIASGSVAHLPHFDAPLRWLCGHVLLEKYAPLESNHGLVDAKVTVWAGSEL